MRILILSNNDSGLYQFRKDLILALSKRGQVFCSIPDEDGYFDRLKELGCICIETKMNRRGKNPIEDIRLLFNYLSLIRKLKPELVVTYTIKPNIYGGIMCQIYHVPYAANITGLGTVFEKRGMLQKIVTMLYKISLGKAETVFFENEGNRQILLDAGVVKKEQAYVLHGAGVNLEHFSLQPYPKKKQAIRFLFVGRVMREKGIFELLAAMKMLIADQIACSLDIVGPYEEDIESELEHDESEGWLRYYGFQDDVRPFINDCDCFVLPSYHEGMANTNLECAASGRPIITSRIHGCMEAVVDGESGFLCEPKSVDSLYHAMKRFCELSWEERKTMGERGRRHMEAVFDKTQVVNKTLERLGIVDNIMNGKSEHR